MTIGNQKQFWAIGNESTSSGGTVDNTTDQYIPYKNGSPPLGEFDDSPLRYNGSILISDVDLELPPNSLRLGSGFRLGAYGDQPLFNSGISGKDYRPVIQRSSEVLESEIPFFVKTVVPTWSTYQAVDTQTLPLTGSFTVDIDAFDNFIALRLKTSAFGSVNGFRFKVTSGLTSVPIFYYPTRTDYENGVGVDQSAGASGIVSFAIYDESISTYEDVTLTIDYEIDSGAILGNVSDEPYLEIEKQTGKIATVAQTGISGITGLVSGGEITLASATTVDIAPAIGYICDFTDSANPIIERVRYDGVSGYDPTASDGTVVLGYDSTGSLTEFAALTNENLREYITMGAVSLISDNVVEITQRPLNVGINTNSDLTRNVIGPANVSGNVFGANGSNLSLDNSGGEIFLIGANFRTDPNISDQKLIAADTALDLYRMYRFGTEHISDGSTYTTIEPGKLDDGTGSLPSVTGGYFTVQQIYITADGVYLVAYGQEEFSSLTLAQAAVISGAIEFEELSPLFDTVRRGFLIVRQDATDLSNPTQATFVDDGKFRGGSKSASQVTGVTTPGGNQDNIQFNNGGTFDGSDDFIWNATEFKSHTTSSIGAEEVDIKHHNTADNQTAQILLQGDGSIDLKTKETSGSLLTRFSIANTGAMLFGPHDTDFAGTPYFNHDYQDVDFYIRKDAPGEQAFIYDAGDDKFSFNSDVDIQGTTVFNSSGVSDLSFIVRNWGGGTAYEFDTNLDRHIFSGYVDFDGCEFAGDFRSTWKYSGTITGITDLGGGQLRAQCGVGDISDGNIGSALIDISGTANYDGWVYATLLNSTNDTFDFPGTYVSSQSGTFAGWTNYAFQQTDNTIDIIKDDGAKAYEYSLLNETHTWSGGITFNQLFEDKDFTIQKETSGNAYVYDAGDDEHTFSGVLRVDNALHVYGAPIFNVDRADVDFHIRNNDSRDAYVYNAGTDRHYFTGDVHILRTNDEDAYFWDESQNRHQFFQDFRMYKTDGTTLSYMHDISENSHFWDSNAVFNNQALDADFTINKLTSGVAYKYDAGNHTHAFSGVTTFEDGDIAFNNGHHEDNFSIGKETSGTAYLYDANLDLHRFSGQFDVVGTAVFNHDNDDYDFYIEKNSSGTAYKYDAGLDTHTFSGDVYTPVLKGLTSMSPVADADFLWTSDAEGGQYTAFELTNADDDVAVKMELQGGGFFRIRTQEPAGSYVTRFTVANDGTLNFGTGDFQVVGNAVFNSSHQDVDFTIGKDTGVENAYVYDAGDDTHIFSGDATFEDDLDYGSLGGVDLYNLGTGTLSGCALSINGGDPTKLDVTAGVCLIADYSTITAPVFKKITVASQQVTPQLSTSWNKWIAVKESATPGVGEIVFDPHFTQIEKRTYAIIGRAWNDGTDDIIDGVGQYTTPGFGQAKGVEDLVDVVGSINKHGNVYSKNGANLLLDKDAGYSFRYSAFWGSDPVSPNTAAVEDPAQTAISAYYYVSQSATSADIRATIDPDQWDNAGSVESVPTGYYTIQRLYFYPSSQVLSVTYGQELFSSLAAAAEKCGFDDPEIEEALLDGAVLRGWLVIGEGTTSLGATGTSILLAANSLSEPTVKGSSNYTSKSYALSDYGSSDLFYMGGYYEAPDTHVVLTIGGTVTETLGTAGKAQGAHAFCVASGAGGTDLVLTVSGTSITDDGVRTTSDSEIIVPDTDEAATNEYFETSKKWLGVVTYTLTGTTGSFTFNYGFAKYEDFGNRQFTVTDFEIVGLASVNGSALDVQLLKHPGKNWVYAASGFVPGTTTDDICSLQTDYTTTDDDIKDEEYFAYKRSNLSASVYGNLEGGVMIKLSMGTNNAIRYATANIGVLI